jgi:Protein of unknown function (DUF3185)
MINSVVNIIILVVGIVLLIMGYNEYGALGSRAGRLLGMGISDRVLVLFIAGAACTAYGLIKMLNRR